MRRHIVRTRVRTLIVASVGASFVVSATLFVAMIISDDSTRLCRSELDVAQPAGDGDVQGHSSSVLRQLYVNNKLPRLPETVDERRRWESDVDGLLRVLLASRNRSIIAARHQLTELRAALTKIERRLDVHSDAADSPTSDDKPALVREPLSQQQQAQAQQYVGVMTDNAGLRGFSKALSLPLDDHVVETLRDIAVKCVVTQQPRPNFTVPHSPVHWPARTAWEHFHNNITQYELYRTSSPRSYVDELLKNMATLPIVDVDEMSKKGTQIKLILRLEDGTKILFKPMRISKDVEANPNHFVFNEMERHHAEIAAFHLDRLLNFRRVPPVAGRYVNMTSEIRPFADKHLNKTFFTSPAGNLCFYSHCTYYCDSHHAVCGNPDVIEGSCAAFLPSEDDLSRSTWKNPWAQLYTKRNQLPRWKTEENYCDEVRSQEPFDTGRRLLDIMDIAVFDFLTGNLDRHHYYTFEDFDNFTSPIITDNGRGFGRARKDDVQLLAPIFQCCLVRASTFVKVVQFLVAEHTTSTRTGSGQSLSAAMRESLSDDVISGVLNAAHLAALDRRIRVVGLLLYDCLDRHSESRDFRRVVIDDGF